MMGNSIARDSSTSSALPPPDPDPNPNITAKNKKKKKKKKNQNQNRSDLESLRDQDQHLSQAENRAREDDNEGREEITEEEKEIANAITSEASSGATATEKNQAPRSPSPPRICPICCEDMDATDASFRPCECGFGLCIFCHNRIGEQGNGRCPACRKPYDGHGPFW